MHAEKARKYVGQYNELQERRARLGLEEATLLASIRGEFPAGSGGDLQFRDWCHRHLESRNTALCLRKANAPRILGDVFPRLRDWDAAATLMNFRKGERKKIVAAINAVRPTTTGLTRGIVKNTGYRLGFRSSLHRRPTTLEVYDRVDRLVCFILSLYGDYEDLPAIPVKVREAMGTAKKRDVARMKDAS
jgi:hypothetical protein